jgi:hypothetical protein
MIPQERRCRPLLLAYPADYRQVRGEEMLDTLLQSTPAGRTWPLPRDCWAMIAGGLRVRTAQNRRLSTPANLRLAATFGCVLYLTFAFYSLAATSLWYLDAGPQGYGYPLLPFAAGLLVAAAVLLVRPGGRKGAVARMVAVAALIAGTAAAVISGPAATIFAQILAALLILAVLALLSRGAERLPRLWLWPPGLVVAVALLAPVARFVSFPQYYFLLTVPFHLYLWAAMALPAAAWIVLDARPAIGLAVLLGLSAPVKVITTRLITTRLAIRLLALPVPERPAFLAMTNATLAGAWSFAWKLLAAAIVLAVLSSWRLRRQAVL